ncbi:hypothetical protein VT03_10195 [Planctomyces sp. SH-PL14]|nr:hypothetical protein VT03_10195 [Planctomyces sp. SH-PL14]
MEADGNTTPFCGSVEADSIGPNAFMVNAPWTTDPAEVAEGIRLDRRERAKQEAQEQGIDPARWEQYADAAEVTFNSVLTVMASPDAPHRREMRKHRRALLKAAFVANGVPWLWQKLVRIGQWSGYVLPFPWNVVVPAIFYMVDRMIGQTERAPSP